MARCSEGKGIAGKGADDSGTPGRTAGPRSADAAGMTATRDAALRWLRMRRSLLLVCLFAAIALEAIGFNHYAWSTMGYQSIANPAISVSDGKSAYGDEHDAISDGITIDIYPGGDASTYVDVQSLRLDMSLGKGMQTAYLYGLSEKSASACALHEVMTVYDEGHAQGYSPELAQLDDAETPADSTTRYGSGHYIEGTVSTGERIVCPAVPDSMRRFLHASGKVSRITLTLKGDFTTATLNSITLNERVPMRFDLVRCLMWFLLFTGIACYFTRRGTCLVPVASPRASAATSRPAPTQAQQCAWLAAMAALMALAAWMQAQETTSGPTYGYADLARSFLSGRLDIDDGSGAALSQMANPYDKTQRSAENLAYPFDSAYYGGRIYVYFGAVPAVVLYLPFRALTGMDLPDAGASMAVVLALVVAGFLLARELRMRLFPDIPWSLYLLLCTVLASVPFLCIMAGLVTIYCISLGAGVAFAEFGLCLWLASVRDSSAGGGSGVRLPLGMAGSLCMALAVGCRPTMVLGSLFAFTIFGEQLRRLREPGMWWRVVLLVLPYLPVAAAIMWYNAARFGSPFQFGAVYQLTRQDMLHLGADPARIAVGFWYYLFALPVLIPEFPFLRYSLTYTQFDGDIFADSNCGGVFAIVPLLLLLFVPSVWRRCRKTAPLRIVAIAIAVIATAADSMMGGLSVRYGGDARYALVLAAVASAMEWLAAACHSAECDGAAESESGASAAVALRRYRLLGALCMVTLLFAAFMAMGPNNDFAFTSDDSNTTLFFRLWDFFDILKL